MDRASRVQAGPARFGSGLGLRSFRLVPGSSCFIWARLYMSRLGFSGREPKSSPARLKERWRGDLKT